MFLGSFTIIASGTRNLFIDGLNTLNAMQINSPGVLLIGAFSKVSGCSIQVHALPVLWFVFIFI